MRGVTRFRGTSSAARHRSMRAATFCRGPRTMVDWLAVGRLTVGDSVEVRRRFDHRNINMDVPEFGEGKLVPTGENLARFIFDRVGAAIAAEAQSARLVRVTVAEDDTLSASYGEL